MHIPTGWDVDESMLTEHIASTGSRADVAANRFAVAVLGTYGATLDEAAKAIIKQNKGRVAYERLPDFELDGIRATHLEGKGISQNKDYFVRMASHYAGVTYNIGFGFDPEVSEEERDQVMDSILASWTWK
ncbi:hypothetical protein [Nocardioides gansuensis]|uniref:hypothetical protein n=1 Tax=Nocardioides gansuensis TaxID=2138300 RepID=UPI00105825A5|nr:hypothetical protein [Nocardioides gansuensis]